MKFIAILILSLSLASCSHSYYIVRHAEKAETTDSVSMNMQNDLPLSEAGKVRALVLKEVLDKKNIDYIFSTNTMRTRSTAAPLSEAVGVPVQLYSTQDSLNAFIQRLKNIESGNVLIVGHSNTVDDIVNLLAGSTKIPGDLKETEYDNLYIIKYTNFLGKRVSFRQEKYGYPSNP
jgi:broad specificity phosphatase PhoE